MTIFQIFRTEFRQNLKLSLVLVIVSFLLGISLNLILQANEKISSLVQHVDWDAQMAILPKGETLDQLVENLRKGEIKALLPEAMYQTTVGLTQGALKLNALLLGRDADGPFLMVQGEGHVNLKWAGIPLRTWHEQSLYSSPDWGTHVIAAAFASGNYENLSKLKDLIDRKTVAQAFWIEDLQRAELGKQTEISHLAWIIELTLILSLFLSAFLAASWIYSSHLNTQTALIDIGFSPFDLRKLQTLLIFSLWVTPFVFGYLLVPAHSI